MAARNRDEFLERDKNVIGERAAYICTYAPCREPTIGPHSNPTKSLKTGKACHIKAAAPGGPRYDRTQTPEERRSPENGIWLCSVCADRIDKDWGPHPAELLHEWKNSHEDWIRNGGIIPKIPQLTLTTLRGLSLPDTPGTIDAEAMKELREHFLSIRNVSDTELLMIDARVQLAEPVAASKDNYIPVGINVGWAPKRMQMMATITGGGKVERLRKPFPTNIYQWQIDRLPPRQHIELGILTSLRPWQEHDLSFDTDLWSGINEPPNTNRFIDGTFQFEYQGATLSKRFFAPIGYDMDKRHQYLIEVLEGRGKWKAIATELFS